MAMALAHRAESIQLKFKAGAYVLCFCAQFDEPGDAPVRILAVSPDGRCYSVQVIGATGEAGVAEEACMDQLSSPLDENHAVFGSRIRLHKQHIRNRENLDLQLI